MARVAAEDEARAAWTAVSAAFASFGRAFLCLDSRFDIIHASSALDDLLDTGSAEAIAGLPAEAVFGRELFGAEGTLRAALLTGERREGWRAQMMPVLPGGKPRLVALSAAPFLHPPEAPCDERVSFVVAVRAAEDDAAASSTTAPVAGIVARSPAMQRIVTLVENLRQSVATVLITGESGTGKEVVARAIHELSPRSAEPFVAVNCGALPPDLLESEMFGHVRGAFTGAVRDRVGRFELASSGTLFLDEVGDLPLALQVKLLRVLQDGGFERVGESRTRTSHARVLAATHVDLPAASRAGRFREDLFYRLRVVPIEIPPLRERREDVEPLARALLARVGARHGRALRFSPDAMRVLLSYDWPGNVRELENALEYTVAVSRGQTILPEDLPDLVNRRPRDGGPLGSHRSTRRVPAGVSAREADSECETLRHALEEHQWSRAQTARALGMSRTTLWRKMREMGLTP